MNFFRHNTLLIATALLLGHLPAGGQGAQPAAPPQPAREVTRYALTTTTQYESHDPTAWRLLASNDDGTNWTVLDVRTNQHFTARSQRMTYYIPNRQPYNTYRLQIDAINSADISVDMSLQLASFDLIGPLVNVPDESKLQMIISASCAHPVTGPAEYAFDDDPTTSWWDYGLGSPGGCWLQVHYASSSLVLVTNLSQATLLTQVSAAQTRLTSGGARIMSNLTAQVVSPRELTGYALTSANDASERDPRDWELLGSNDGGKTWTRLEKRANEVFTDRFERRVFTLTNAVSFRMFRLQIDATAISNNPCQLAEIEPLYADPQAASQYSLVVGATADNPPLESTEMAFDGDPRTKWLCLFAADPSAPLWVQWQLTPREEDLPVINEHQLDLLAERLAVKQLLGQTNPVAVRIRGYALTSANDFPARDPRDWKLLASNDGGRSWDLLDTRQGEQFTERFQRRVFSLDRPVSGQLFRLQVDSVFAPTNANSVQLGQLELLYDDPKTATTLTVLASSQSENSPVETVDQLFDNDSRSKWLDYSASSSNHSSWVEWRYVQGAAHQAIDMNRQHATAALSPEAYQLQLPATVLFADPARGWAGLGDATGFRWLHLSPWPEGLAPGVQAAFSGKLSVRGGLLFVTQARADERHALPAQGHGRSAQSNFCLGSVTVRVAGVFSASSYCGATLTLADGLPFEARLPGRQFPVPPNLACPVKIEGVIENLLAGRAERVPGIIWVANPQAITLAPESEEDWNQLPDYSPKVLLPAPVRFFGTLEPAEAEKGVFIRADTNRIAVDLREQGSVAGTNVEAAGMLDNEGGRLVLHHPCLRAARPPATNATPRLTQVSAVQQFLNRYPTNNAEVKIRGVITYIDLNMGEFYLQDGDVGLDVVGQMNAGLCPKLAEEGNYVEVKGQVVAGTLFATAFAEVLGKGRLPRPAQPSWDGMIAGTMDNRWVEVEGTIVAMEKQRFTLNVGGGRLNVWINELDQRTADSLVGSLVRVRGVCSSIINVHNQRLGVRLLVPSSTCIDLLGLEPAKPFDLPLSPISAVMSADFSLADPQQRYARTRGVVTCKQGRLLFLQDETTGLRVALREDLAVVPGDVVDAVGRPQPDGFSAKLIQAVIRKMGHGPVPPAVPVDLARISMSDLTQQQDATRVQLEGILVNESADATRRTLNLRNEAARQVFSAYLPPDDATHPAAAIPEGSRLRIKGIFKAVLDKTPDIGQEAATFEIYVNSGADLTVLERPSWWTARHTLGLMGFFAGVLAVGLAWIWLLRNQVRQRTHDLALKVDELKRSEASLAAEVTERERLQGAADQAHKQLLAVARQAGMAEVATGILHNVGNVLNSVNVSSTIARDKLRALRTEGLEKAVAMLRQNETQLATFLETDKGKNLLSYLSQLSSHLTANQAGTLKELENLDKNVQHIKDIVVVQQDYARCSGLTEKMHVADLVEDALRITASSLERHKIQIARDFDPRTPEVEVDRHKVLQILVNVLQNAQQACDESGRADKRIVIGIGPVDGNVRIAVADNGVGIAPENLECVFRHGFTTRRHGHGFGLHNAALTAKEMGGGLRVESAGVGQGAKFTLELPQERTISGPAPE